MTVNIRRIEDVDADKAHFKGFGISGTATAGQVTNIDYKLTEERLVYGGQALLQNHSFGDTICFQVVDVDNILGYGADLVLGEYMKDWYVVSDVQKQELINVTFPTRIAANLYFRIKYTSVGGSNVDVKVNIFSLKNITV